MFARLACLNVPQWGAVNGVVLGRFDTEEDRPHGSQPVNFVVAGLLRLLTTSQSKRVQYHVLLALANLAQDTTQSVPMYAYVVL